MTETLDMEAMYAQLQKQQVEKAKAEAEAVKDFNDPTMLNMKQGNAYEMRLMMYTTGIPGDRLVPIIKKTVHAYKDPNTNIYHEVTCPTSDYLLGRQGYRSCPICGELSKLWDLKEKGSTAAEAAYKNFKRKFKGYGVAYIINDPTTPENNGTFKIVYFNTMMNDFLTKEIDGLDKKGNVINGARPIKFKAFDPGPNGKNLMITVTKDGDWSKHECKFVDPEGPLDITLDQIAEAFDTLEFDKRYTQFDPKASQEFYEDLILGKEEAPKEEAPKEAVEAPAETPVEAPAETPDEKEAPATKSNTPNVDDILAGLPI